MFGTARLFLLTSADTFLLLFAPAGTSPPSPSTPSRPRRLPWPRRAWTPSWRSPSWSRTLARLPMWSPSTGRGPNLSVVVVALSTWPCCLADPVRLPLLWATEPLCMLQVACTLCFRRRPNVRLPLYLHACCGPHAHSDAFCPLAAMSAPACLLRAARTL